MVMKNDNYKPTFHKMRTPTKITFYNFSSVKSALEMAASQALYALKTTPTYERLGTLKALVDAEKDTYLLEFIVHNQKY